MRLFLAVSLVVGGHSALTPADLYLILDDELKFFMKQLDYELEIFIIELFFCKKKYLLVGASLMLWTGQWASE